MYGLNTLAFLAGMVVFSWIAPQVNMFYAFKLFNEAFEPIYNNEQNDLGPVGINPPAESSCSFAEWIEIQRFQDPRWPAA